MFYGINIGLLLLPILDNYKRHRKKFDVIVLYERTQEKVWLKN